MRPRAASRGTPSGPLRWCSSPAPRTSSPSGPAGCSANRLREQDPSLEVHDLDAGAYGPGELLTLASPSLFGEPRLIRVDAVEKCTDEFLEEMLSYLAAPADDTVVVLRHSGGVRGKRLLDAIRTGRSGAIEITAIPLKGGPGVRGLRPRRVPCGRDGRSRRGRCGRSSPRSRAISAELAAACRQLIDDADDDITEVTVDRYYGGRVETTAFEVADAAIAGRTGDALILLRHALDSGADPVPVVAAFALKLRAMAKVIGARGGGAELAGRLGMAPWQVRPGAA